MTPATSFYRRLREILLLLVGLYVVGTLGFVWLEGWSLFDAFYMTAVTLATVGYGDFTPKTTGGRAFTIALIFVGIGTFTYALTTFTTFWIEFRVFDKLERRRMDKAIDALRDHVILCGGGDSAVHIARELRQSRTPFVVIEIDPARVERLHQIDEDLLSITGDASDSDMLVAAGIERARGLIACLPTDRDNLFTVIEAREYNPTMRVVTRLISNEARPKFVKAGANAMVSGLQIGALRLASEMLRPSVVTVLDQMLRVPGDVRIQEIPVGSGGAGKSIAQLDLQARAGVAVFAMLEAPAMGHLFNPPPTRVLREGDVLIACADPAQLVTARRVAGGG